jgi:pyruvate dehydrogenase E2 component (dihydrolipoamide acetyltransferase)|tara:strand:+ start:80 stop:361 length:282 start_codon:yes stop_codon:yes gene_type:complete
MVYQFKFPDVGEGIHEGEIVSWKVKEGDVVQEDQNLVEVETDKAIVEIPSPKAGKIVKINGKAGDTIDVGDVLVEIEEGSSEQPEASEDSSDE